MGQLTNIYFPKELNIGTSLFPMTFLCQKVS